MGLPRCQHGPGPFLVRLRRAASRGGAQVTLTLTLTLTLTPTLTLTLPPTLTLTLTPTPTLTLILTLTLTRTLTPTLTAVARSRVKSYAVKHFWAYYKPWRQTSSFWCRRWYTFLDDDAAFGPASTQELGGATQGHGAGRSDSTWSVDSSPPATGQGGQSGQVPRASRSDSRCVRQLSATRARVLALNASDGKNKCKGVWSKVF